MHVKVAILSLLLFTGTSVAARQHPVYLATATGRITGNDPGATVFAPAQLNDLQQAATDIFRRPDDHALRVSML